MRYLLDTNICIYLIKKKPPEVLQKFNTCQIGDIGISVISVAELEYGVKTSQRPQQNQQALAQFLLPLSILDFDSSAAIYYGEIRAYLEKQGRPIGALDLFIAAVALSRNLTLITNNTSEFQRIPDLLLENWIDK
jgi:tRNA(fMet)-specific endonuclease VapC